MPTRINSVVNDLEINADRQEGTLLNYTTDLLLTQYLPSVYEMQFWSMYVDCALDKQNLQDLIKLALQQQHNLTRQAIKYQESKDHQYLSQLNRDKQTVNILVDISYGLYSYAITQNRDALLQITTNAYDKLAILNVEYTLVQIAKYLINPLTKKRTVSGAGYLN